LDLATAAWSPVVLWNAFEIPVPSYGLSGLHHHHRYTLSVVADSFLIWRPMLWRRVTHNRKRNRHRIFITYFIS